MNPKYIFNTGILANQATLKFFESRYKCRHCGRCCSGDFFKWAHLLSGDGPRIARYLNMDLAEFYRQHCGQENYQTYLKFPCPFLAAFDHSCVCKIYEVRGQSCRTFPIARLVAGKLETVGIDLRCPAGAELAEEFKKEDAAHAGQKRKN
jgi:Fe-S-cluster containining protein